MAGLRRNEIDKLPWTAFNWDGCTLRVEVTEHFDAKSEDSIGEVDVDPEFLEFFRRFKSSAFGPFVIELSGGAGELRCHSLHSDMLHFWYEKRLLLRPTYPWEFMQSSVSPRPGAGYSHYRCKRIFERLSKVG